MSGKSRRREDREDFDIPTRVGLLEVDMDNYELSQDRIFTELRRLRTILMSLLIAITTSTVLLAVNIGIESASAGTFIP